MTLHGALTAAMVGMLLTYVFLNWLANQRRRSYIALRDRLQQHGDTIWQEGFRRGYLRGHEEGLRTFHPGVDEISIQQVPLRPDGTPDQVRLAEMIAEQIASAPAPRPGPLPGSRLHGNPRVN